MAKPRTKISAILWDLDGTLVDTEALHAALERAVLTDLGVPTTDIEAAMAGDNWVGLSTRDAFSQAFKAWGRPEALDEAVSELERRLEREVIQRAQPRRGVNRMLVDIPARTTRFAIVTSSRRRMAEALVERFGWGWRFETLVTADDVRAHKPQPEPYRLACERLGITPDQALAVEDSPNGIASARAAGVRCAAVVGTFQHDALSTANWVLSDVGAVAGLLGVLAS